MKAYYNEIDPWCVKELKRLIAEGELPDGDVDDRDIRSVPGDDLRGYGQVHLFAGIGGFALACRLAGWPDHRPIWTGGFPCQPFSVAGLRQGKSDDRFLWPEVSRLLQSQEERPAWCLFENVDGITDLALDRVLFDMETLDYAARPYWVPACAVNAPHQRMRVWIVGRCEGVDDAAGARQQSAGQGSESQTQDETRVRGPECGCGSVGLANAAEQSEREPHDETGAVSREWARGDSGGDSGCSEHVGNSIDTGLQRRPFSAKCRRKHSSGQTGLELWSQYVWIIGQDGKARRIEPGIAPLAHGVPERVSKLKGYGNAIVPQDAVPFLDTMLKVA